MARLKIKVVFKGQQIRNNPTPINLGIRLDKTLTHKDHLTRVVVKIKTRNSTINKLAHANWGSDPNIRRISMLAFSNLVAEYCVPVWLKSSHSNKNKTQKCGISLEQ